VVHVYVLDLMFRLVVVMTGNMRFYVTIMTVKIFV